MIRTMCVAVLLSGVALPAAAQVVTEVKRGDTIVVAGVGEVRLAGIRSIDESAFQVGGRQPQVGPPTEPGTLPPPVIGGRVLTKPERPTTKALQTLVLGRTVRLQYDQEADAPRVAYVFLPDDTLVNAELLRNGDAELDASEPFERLHEFRALEAEARRNGIGVWGGTRQ